MEPGRAWSLQSFARPGLVISVWLQVKIGEVGWGGKCWLCSGVLLPNRNFKSTGSLFFFGARNLMMAYLWCLPVMMFFPPEGVPSTPPYPSVLNSNIWGPGTWKSVGFQGSSTKASQPPSLRILLRAGWQNLLRAGTSAVLCNVKSTNNCQLGHMLWTPAEWLLCVVLEKGQNKEKSLD